MSPTINRRRQKIGATLDPVLLAVVDRFVQHHPEFDRSKVIEEALYLWLAREQNREMELQFSESLTDAVREERDAWHRIQDEAAKEMFGRPH